MAVSRQYDSVFQIHGAGLPVAYIRSLAKKESDLNPTSKGVSAWGILQITEVVRRDYNSRHNAGWTRNDLLNPDVCTMIACDLLRRIVSAYQTNHGAIRNMGEDWHNPRFVELLTFGWNAGYSQGGGVQKVVKHLAEQGHREVTIDSVRAAVRAAGAAESLDRDDKVSWCKGVTSLYMSEKDSTDGEQDDGSVLLSVGIVGTIALKIGLIG